MITNTHSWSLEFSSRSFTEEEATPNKSLDPFEPSIPIHLSGDPLAITYAPIAYSPHRLPQRIGPFRPFPFRPTRPTGPTGPTQPTLSARKRPPKTHSVYKKTHSTPQPHQRSKQSNNPNNSL